MLIDLVLDPTDRRAPDLIEAARAAEQLGFSGVWTYDHLSGSALGGRSTQDVWTLLGAIAQATTRVAIGPLVTNITTRHPALIAIAAATLQELSGGRVILGLGAGAGPASEFSREMRMVGMTPLPAADRRAMVVEAIRVIRGLWSGEHDLPGSYFALEGARGFIAPNPTPPIYVGCNGPKLTALAAPIADGVNFHSVESDLAGLVELARSNAGPRRVDVTVEAPLAADDVARMGGLVDQLLGMGVDRLMVRWSPGLALDQVDKAAAHLFS